MDFFNCSREIFSFFTRRLLKTFQIKEGCDAKAMVSVEVRVKIRTEERLIPGYGCSEVRFKVGTERKLCREAGQRGAKSQPACTPRPRTHFCKVYSMQSNVELTGGSMPRGVPTQVNSSDVVAGSFGL